MRLSLIAAIYDSAELLERFVRHNARLVDRIYLFDDGCRDASREILQRLQDEGLDIVVVERPAWHGFYQGRSSGELVKRALADEVWDFILPLDDDEFIVADSRDQLETGLASVPPDHTPSLSSLHYIPCEADDATETDCLKRLRHALDWGDTPFKAIVPGRLIADGSTRLSDGNHYLARGHTLLPRQVIPHCRLAHFPVRSQEQFFSRSLQHYIRWRMRADFDQTMADHRWRIVAALRAQDSFCVSPSDYERIAQFDFHRIADSGSLTHAPFDTRHAIQRYPELAALRPFDLVMHSVDELLEAFREQQQPPQAQPVPSQPPPRSLLHRLFRR